MYIRKTKIEDLDKLMRLFEDARKFMAENGNPTQWGKTNPPRSRIELDISQNISYVCIDELGESGIKTDDGIVGTFVYFYGKDVDPNYEVIRDGKWSDDEPYGVVHRMTTLRGTQGVGKFILDWAYEQCHHLRIDTHKNNIPMQNLVRKCGFEYCGIVQMITQDGTDRDAFMKG